MARTDGNPNVDPYFTRKRTTVTKRNRTAICCSNEIKGVTRRLTISQRLDRSNEGPHLRGVRRRALVRVRGEEKSQPDDKSAIKTDEAILRPGLKCTDNVTQRGSGAFSNIRPVRSCVCRFLDIPQN